MIIIGAGMGGLSTGCYAQMNGFDTKIFEMHSLPGGQCTAWKRGGFTFDGCIHHLAGCKSGYLLYQLWEELGAFPALQPIFPEDMCQVEDEAGKRFTVYVDLERLGQQMLELAPQDASAINSYIKAAKTFETLDMLDTPLLDSADFTKRFLKMASILKNGMPMTKYAEKFSDPYLKKTFPTIQYDWTETPTFVHLNMIGNCSSKNYGVVAGGSLEFSKAIVQRYQKLGGAINYGKKVEKVLVEVDQAVGVRLLDGTEMRADLVVSDTFGYSTVFGLLGGQYVDDKIKAQFSKPEDNMIMGIHVSFGLSRDLSKEPRALVLFLKKPVKIADREHAKLDLELFGYDPSLAPHGKGVLKVLLNTSYGFWSELYKNREKYKLEKNRVAQSVLDNLEGRFPGIKDQVEVTDVATPMTMERFTGNGQGYEAHWGFFDMLRMLRGPPKTLPGLKGFFMVGISAGGAGVSGCGAMGRNLVKKLCKDEGKPFEVSKQ
jgi:phytoene dehydrogenase-like protein